MLQCTFIKRQSKCQNFFAQRVEYKCAQISSGQFRRKRFLDSREEGEERQGLYEDGLTLCIVHTEKKTTPFFLSKLTQSKSKIRDNETLAEVFTSIFLVLSSQKLFVYFLCIWFKSLFLYCKQCMLKCRSICKA